MSSMEGFPLQLRNTLLGMLENVQSNEDFALYLRSCAKVRAQALSKEYLACQGNVVMRGPFKGMTYLPEAAEGGFIPRAIGIYERSLRPIIETVIASDYAAVLDIGAAEGYYAVGLARRMPKCKIIAYDISPKARTLCEKLATINGVAGQVDIRDACTFAEFDICAREKTFIFCDIEGEEGALLDLRQAPALAMADILVETHPHQSPDVVEVLSERFSGTHNITRIGRYVADDELPEWAESYGDLDRLLMLWEWRYRPTPWLWMTRK